MTTLITWSQETGTMSDALDENQELCIDFVVESREMIGEVEPVLVELEAESASSGGIDISRIDSIFRAFHSMKGSGGFLDLNNLVAVTHQAESLLDTFRKGTAQLAPRHITVLCKAIDFIVGLLDQIEAEFHDSGWESEAQTLVEEIRGEMEESAGSSVEPQDSEPPTLEPETSSLEATASEAASGPRSTDAESGARVDADLSLAITDDLVESFVTDALEQLDSAESSLLQLESDPNQVNLVAVAFRSLHSLKGNCGFFGYSEMEGLAHQMETLLDVARESGEAPSQTVVTQLLEQLDHLRRLTDALQSREAVEQPGEAKAPAEISGEIPEPVSGTPQGSTPGVSSAAPVNNREQKRRQSSVSNIRVDLDKLDTLMDLVGELILAETMVTHNPDLEGHHFEDFQKASLQLNRITRSIQDVAMSVRMIPISGTFRKMLRLVRDLARKQQKQIDLVLIGEETEIDKTVVEAIADPLVHLIRNSVDHGIENPEDRVLAGKPETGQIRLEAKHEGGEIWITIEDDGKGLNRNAILEKAQAKGLIDPSREDLSDAEIYRFIFAPGFSTAAEVTDVSGRGVGMDVVRRNIDELGGRVDIDSRLGLGSTITIRLPLTLAIVEGMLVRVGESVYTIPLLAIRESVTVKPGDVTRLSDGQEMVNIRGDLLPILRIQELHGVPGAETDLGKGILVVIEEHGHSFAAFVDELVGQRQTVIKALPKYLGSVTGVSGCSILSNGDISLILDAKAIQAEWAPRVDS